MAVSAACLMSSYEFVRNTSNTLVKVEYGLTSLALIYAIMPLGVLALLFIYNKLLSYFGPQKTITISIIGSSLVILLCYFLHTMGIKASVVALMIFREAYIVLIVEQMWSFISSIVTLRKAKVFYSIVLSISTLGSVLGGWGVYYLAESLGTSTLLTVAALGLFPTALLAHLAYSNSTCIKTENKSQKTSTNNNLGASLFIKQPVLTGTLIIVITSQVYSTLVELAFQSSLHINIPDADAQTSASGLFFGYLSLTALLGQVFVAPLMLSKLPLYVIHFCIPGIHFMALIFLLIRDDLYSAGLVFILFKSLDYSVFRAAKEILYLPLSFDARFRTKSLIDVFGYRASKGATSIGLSLFQFKQGVLPVSFLGKMGSLALIIWVVTVGPTLKYWRKAYDNKD